MLSRLLAKVGPVFLVSIGSGLGVAGIEAAFDGGGINQWAALAIACIVMLASGAWWLVKREMEKLNRLPSEDWYRRVNVLLDDLPIVQRDVKNLEQWRTEHREDANRQLTDLNTTIANQQKRIEALSDMQKEVLRGLARP